MNIYLIGSRCCGKTSVGRHLARKLGWEFLDADQMLVSSTGVSIKAFVEQNGWDRFREQEKRQMAEICHLQRYVVATGGGVVLDPGNVRLMQKTGKLIWLRAAPKTVLERIQRDETSAEFRPTLTGQGMAAEIETVLSTRTPLYQKAADFAVDTDGLNVKAVTANVREYLSKEGILSRAGK